MQKKPGAALPPVSADDDELSLIKLFATGTRRRGSTSFRKQRSAMKAEQLRNALGILSARGLVELGPGSEGRSKYEAMWLANEGGAAPGQDLARYRLPAATEPTLSIPIEFFTNGWIQVLTDSEIWNWLAFRHAGNMKQADSPPAKDIELPADERLGRYELTRDAWDTRAMLDSLGLMTVNPGEIKTDLTASGQRFRRDPHRFDLHDKALRTPGHRAVMSAVETAHESALAN